ncbi:hypothetical protein SAMN04487943_101512 [Gracilibacillus orientalis]|uniref:Uncharacterized protein n=1 Tax=Gracilibacillus orientalis TaxID=334253 RepID=A0A1I4HN14_9BACI|nr:hypothetical protein [Gracilibacillus orientalis]SFL43123.1 hypothetical protein SAMN04487943_101512 [Gracilibacillus orientalis]
MSEYFAKRLRISKESYEYMQEYAQKHYIPQDNRIINNIIEDHKEMTSLENREQDFIENISDNISKEINKEIRRIRLGTNNTDRNKNKE